MSANRDKTQRIAFVYSNLYRIYKEGDAKTLEVDNNRPGLSTVLNVQKSALSKGAAPEILRELPSDARVETTQNAALAGLKDNLKQLNDLQSRLRFMLRELEEVIDDEPSDH